ncbi:prepilin-type N-terminal cleavage/methylation domain-containing protein [Shewanella sp. JM162201]|uniref:Prepilin-type N-terminal cleavage/methylation domain-containing protein n=1 Tax=Shewanella jiangmenensis TaxID=2837387 RepID=A0ABS5UZZ3_9GAMM|nr:type IV pilin protein [Shewanella jiangmenensis]MBT1443796.1 prepilin-type N-terminal cleavage/methylation domain-containing protein [Shewanella jiangmenensis]
MAWKHPRNLTLSGKLSSKLRASLTSSTSSTGFTLIELMIVVAIVGIIAAIALPSYQEYLKKGRRFDAQQQLISLSHGLERSYSRDGAYPNAIASLPSDDFYTYSYSQTGGTEYELKATPTSRQSDSCGALTLNQKGVEGAAKAGCWE